MSKPLVSAAIVSALSFGSIGLAQAQTHTAPDATRNPSIAMQTAPGGADARKLLGRNVNNASSETIGEIKSIHLDPNGKVDGIIVAVGGFLGVGEREVLLNWRDLQIDANGEVVHTNMTKDQLKAMSPYTY